MMKLLKEYQLGQLIALDYKQLLIVIVISHYMYIAMYLYMYTHTY